MTKEKLSNEYMQKEILHTKLKIMHNDPFKDQVITHRRRYYKETENNTLPEYYI